MNVPDRPPRVILIVDDEEMIRMALELVLSSEGYLTISAGDGQEAIDILNQRVVDLVITDMKMPRANGMDVLRAAKTRDPGIKVIMITGFAAEEPALALSEGADEFIFKVFKRDDILGAVRRLLAEGPRPGEPPSH